MLTVLAVPAMAQNFNRNFNNGFFFPNNFNNGFFPNNFNNGNFVANDVSNESESGDVTPSFSVESTGNNSNQCVTPLQFGNTGNFNNGQSFLQFDSLSGDLEGEGGEFNFNPVLSAPCNQSVEQSSAANSY
jgi:hypothetical protein